MCNVYNQIGCLTVVKSHLERNNITDFSSIKELIRFQNQYQFARQNIISNSQVAIRNEQIKIEADNDWLTNSIETTKGEVSKKLGEQIVSFKSKLEMLTVSESNSVFRTIGNYFKRVLLKQKIKRYEKNLPKKVFNAARNLLTKYEHNQRRHNYITTEFHNAVLENCSAELRILENKRAVIDEINTSIYGAIGEQKVVRELEKLSDDYTLINDFRMYFNPAIYNSADGDYIKSIQIDHLLIGPPGIFLIETKNWSEHSLNNINLHSPIKQLKRTNYALYRVLKESTKFYGLDQHHWGRKKVTLRNLLVLINRKPIGEFEYVHILSLNQLLGYIKYFPPIYTRRETEQIASELLALSIR